MSLLSAVTQETVLSERFDKLMDFVVLLHRSSIFSFMTARMVRKAMLTLLILVAGSMELEEEDEWQQLLPEEAMVAQPVEDMAMGMAVMVPEVVAVELEEDVAMTAMVAEAEAMAEVEVEAIVTLEPLLLPCEKLNKSHCDCVDKNLVKFLKTPHAFSVLFW